MKNWNASTCNTKSNKIYSNKNFLSQNNLTFYKTLYYFNFKNHLLLDDIHSTLKWKFQLFIGCFLMSVFEFIIIFKLIHFLQLTITYISLK